MDIVIQGLYYEATPTLIDSFLQCDFVDHIIFSTWKDTEINVDSRICTIFSDDVEIPGIGNRNRQIKSTRVGLEYVVSSVCAKFRSDQVFPVDTLKFMNEFYQEHQDGSKIFALGLYKIHPFHPRDHMFWGPTEKMKILFDCPYDLESDSDDYSGSSLRSEAWLGCHYAARHYTEIAEMLKNYQMFLVDDAPKIDEAYAAQEKYYHQLFSSFPEVHHWWPKIGLGPEQGYYYEYVKREFSQYTFEEMEKWNRKD